MSIRSDKRDARCIKLKRERGNLYEKRSYYNKRLAGELDDAARATAESKLAGVYERIEYLNPQIYRCGQQFDKLDRKKRNLQSSIYYRKRVIRDQDLSQTERNRRYKQMRSYVEQVNDINKIFGYGVYEVKGEVKFAFDEKSRTGQEIMPVWRAPESVRTLVESGKFKTIDIDGQVYSTLPEDRINIEMEMTDFITNVQARQHKTGTPMVIITTDLKSKHITVAVFTMT